MNKTLKIQGMHCESCKTLILMELEENGFEKNVVNLELLGDDKGELIVNNVDERQIEHIKAIINSMDGYEVI